MEKRYQVFISSTFQDLIKARQEVSQALLRADCFPAGMELFPAADEEQFAFIKTVIDQSDFYIVITAGRYGSIHPQAGLSYTEMEYDYAVATGKPVIRLLHKDPFNALKGEFIEKTDKGRKALQNFRLKLQRGSLVNFWDDPKDLGMAVTFGLRDAEKRHPASGWIRNKNLLALDAGISGNARIVLEFISYEGSVSLEEMQQSAKTDGFFADRNHKIDPMAVKGMVSMLARAGYIYQDFHWDTRTITPEDIWDQTWSITGIGNRILELSLTDNRVKGTGLTPPQNPVSFAVRAALMGDDSASRLKVDLNEMLKLARHYQADGSPPGDVMERLVATAETAGLKPKLINPSSDGNWRIEFLGTLDAITMINGQLAIDWDFP